MGLLGAGPGPAPGLLLWLGGSVALQPQAQLEDRTALVVGPGAISLTAASASAL